MTSITPIQRQSTPAMDRHSSTPAAAPSMAAAGTAGPRPVASPHSTDNTTMPVQMIVIAIAPPSLSTLIYTHVPLQKYLRGKPFTVLQKFS